jgi:hypothetical protein
MRQRVRLVNLKLGDPDDVEIYAGAACWEWMQREEFQRLKTYGINERELYWTNGAMTPHSITVDIWADVEPEVAALIKLSGLCQL